MKQALLALLLVFGLSSAQAANMSVEVTKLLGQLSTSGCQFYRNGSWHSGPEASEHLKRKYKALSDKHLLRSTEDFIAKGATQSSVSGEAYQVRCGGKEPEPSAVYLRRQLQALRGQG